MAGKAELIGVYSLPVDDALVAAQARELYGDNPSAAQADEVREQLQSTVLVEVLISNADAKFDVGEFTQEDPQLPSSNWQAAWAEAFLTTDGQQLLVERWGSLPDNETDFRVAFFIHYWKAGNSLRTSYGALRPQPPSSMPERLHRLVPYVAVD